MPKRCNGSLLWQAPIIAEGLGPPKIKRRKVTPKERQHAPEKWITHREKIEKLFKTCEVGEVARIMREEEGFDASQVVSQYRHQLDEWKTPWKHLPALSSNQKRYLKENAIDRAMDFKPHIAARLHGRKIPSLKLCGLLKTIMPDSTYGSVEELVDAKIAKDAAAKAERDQDSHFIEALPPPDQVTETEPSKNDDIPVDHLIDFATLSALEAAPGVRRSGREAATSRSRGNSSVGASWSHFSDKYMRHHSSLAMSIYSSRSSRASICSFAGRPSMTEQIKSISPLPPKDGIVNDIGGSSDSIRTRDDLLRWKREKVKDTELELIHEWIRSYVHAYPSQQGLIDSGRSLQLFIFQKESVEVANGYNELVPIGEDIFTAALVIVSTDPRFGSTYPGHCFKIEVYARYRVLLPRSHYPAGDLGSSGLHTVQCANPICGGLLLSLPYIAPYVDAVSSLDIKRVITYSVKSISYPMAVAPLREMASPLADMEPDSTMLSACTCGDMDGITEAGAYSFSSKRIMGEAVHPMDIIRFF